MIYFNVDPVEMLPGVVRRTLADGGTMMVCEFTIDAGSEVPMHAHPNDQVGYVTSGQLPAPVRC